jgi:hypothetical protein
MLVVSVHCLFSACMHEIYVDHIVHFLILNTYIEFLDVVEPSLRS